MLESLKSRAKAFVESVSVVVKVAQSLDDAQARFAKTVDLVPFVVAFTASRCVPHA